MIRLIDFEAAHAVELLEHYKHRFADWKFADEAWFANMKRAERSFSLIDNGNLIVSGGIVPIFEGLGEAWLEPSDKITDYKLRMIKTLRHHIDKITEEDGLRRLQAAVRADFPEAVRFIEFMGFKREGLMEAYGPDGSDYFLYARINKWSK